MRNVRKIKLFDYETKDWIFLGLMIIVALWMFVPGLRADRMMLPMPDDIFIDSSRAYDLAYGEVPTSDVNVMYQPWNDYACERLKAGEIPFWDPYNLCGTPFFANSLNQLTYIPRLLFSIILPSETVLTALALLHFLLIGIGFYYLLKAYNLSPLVSGIASFILLFKFSLPAIMMTPPIALTFAYTPLCLLLLLKILRGGRWLFTLYLAICLSCILSSGYPVYTAHLLYLGLAVMIFEFLQLRKTGGFNPAFGIWRVIIGTVLSILISLTQLIPLAVYFSMAARPQIFEQHFANFSTNFTWMIFILYQNILFPAKEGIHSTLASSQANLYLGILPLLIALPLYGQWRESRYRFFLFASIIFGAICFLTPIARFALRFIPGFGLTPILPYPTLLFLIIIAFALSLEHILKQTEKVTVIRTALIIGVTVVFAFVPLTFVVLKKMDGGFLPNYITFILSAILVIIGLLILYKRSRAKPLAYILIFLFALNYLPIMKRWATFYGPEGSAGVIAKQLRESRVDDIELTTRYFNATRSSFLPVNTNIYLRLPFVQGYNALVPSHFADEWAKHFPEGVLKSRRLAVAMAEPTYDFLEITGVSRVMRKPDEQYNNIHIFNKTTQIYFDYTGYRHSRGRLGSCRIFRPKPEKMNIRKRYVDLTDIEIAETYYPSWRYNLSHETESHPVEKSSSGFIHIPVQTNEQFTLTLYYDPYLEKLGLILASVWFIIGLIVITTLDMRGRKPE